MSTEPIFVVGVERSGTTLLSFMLSAHSEIAIPYESHFITHFAQTRSDASNFATPEARRKLFADILGGRHVKNWHPRVDLGDLALGNATDLSHAISELFTTYARKAGKTRWGDKTPSYLRDLDVLNGLFPTAKFIHIIRDGRDVAMSLLAMEWGPPDYLSALNKWNGSVEIARKMLAMLPSERWLELRFEDLVLSPEANIRRICGFLNVDFEPKMIDGYTKDWNVRTAAAVPGIHSNLSRPPDASQVFKWKLEMSGADQAIAHELAGELLASLGYPAGRTSHPLRIPRKVRHRLLETIRFRIKSKQG